ncbi:MAG: CbiX/SirB N-terminal domain-containing protein [Thermodesulfobacteriota bacterium]
MKALILVDHGSKVKEANNLLEEIVIKLRNHPGCKFDMVEHSHMELATPTIEDAFLKCVKKGAKEIVVHPYFLVPGRHSKTDIPRMVKEAASPYPDVKYKVSQPLGIHNKILDVVLERAWE